jgi:hypothetical protein
MTHAAPQGLPQLQDRGRARNLFGCPGSASSRLGGSRPRGGQLEQLDMDGDRIGRRLIRCVIEGADDPLLQGVGAAIAPPSQPADQPLVGRSAAPGSSRLPVAVVLDAGVEQVDHLRDSLLPQFGATFRRVNPTQVTATVELCE